MKNNSFTKSPWFCLCITALLLAATERSPAQNTPVTNPIPQVLVAASDANASEAGDPGMFHIYRDGVATNVELSVAFAIGGTASNGVDYAELPHSVTFPIGVRVVELPVLPIQDTLVEGAETVILKLLPAATTTAAGTYSIGVYSNATVTIADADVPPPPTNRAPYVYIYSPTNGAIFAPPANILLTAKALDPDTNDFVATVEFFSGTNSLGVVSNTNPSPTAANAAVSFLLPWNNVPTGVYELRARATDTHGASTLSAMVRVTVTNLPPPPPTNRAPYVYIFSPTNGAVLPAPANILINANALDPDTNDFVTTVEFFSGSVSLGVATNNPAAASSVNPFHIAWNNVPPGQYELRARATDTHGASTLSAMVRVTVTNLPPPLPVVTIVATDPLAEEIPPVPPGLGIPQAFNPAVFTVTRAGDTNFDLDVAYAIGGTASNGVDYSTLSGSVTIPAGAAAANIVVNPIDDLLVEGAETVILHLIAPACATIYPPPTGCYVVGTPSEARAYIADNETITNPPPATNLPIVTITAPDAIAVEGTNYYQLSGSNTLNTPSAYFTNNTATFAIRRTGDSNASLTVYYGISGTASNGVDYLPLPGVATIPAGRHAVEIIIRPVDDDLVETNETVVLTLRPPAESNTTNPPTYKIGYPYRAGAVIVDNDRPRPTTGTLPDRSFNLTVPATDGTWYHVEYSTNFVDWTPICTNMVTKGAIQFIDPEAGENVKRYYRAVTEPVPPTIQP